MSNRRIYLIDATAFCYRAFYALGNLATSFGQPTNAIYGFTNMLNKVLKENRPEFLAVCFDVSRDTFRQKKFAEYKINRPPMPEGLSGQIPLIKEILSAYGIAILEKEGFEADDIIATLVKKAKEKKVCVTIISSDKDILQLVDDEVVVFSPYKDAGVVYDHKKVFARFGIEPEKIPDLIALMGDDADNIPGVPGIGEKTAVGLISKFGSLEKLLAQIENIGSVKIKKAITQNLEKIKLNKELAVLDERVEIDLDLERLKVKEPDYHELFRLFKYFEFKRLLKNLPLPQEAPLDLKIVRLKDEAAAKLLDGQEELVVAGENLDNLFFYAGGTLFSLEKIGVNFKNILANPQIKKIGHDLKKIKVFLAKEKITLEGLSFDLKIAAYLLNPSKPGYHLSDIVWDYLGKPPALKSTGDAGATDLILKLKPILEHQLREKSLFTLFRDIEMPLVEVLAQMELNGIKLDVEILNKLSKDIEKRLIKLIEDIYEKSGAQFNINSPKQLREVLFGKLNLPVVKKTKTGPSTDEEVLRNLAKLHCLPALLLEYRQLSKLKSTYIDALPPLVDEHTGCIHTSFNQAGTETGRLSSSDPNLQNLPVKTEIGRKIREAVIASGRNNYLLSGDYSQIELRVLAHLAKDENLISAFKQNKDIHKATAALIYGLDEAEVDDNMRETAKRVNFGIVYGLTPYGLSRDLGIAVDQAGGFIDAYFLRFPRVKEYIAEQIDKAEANGFVTTILGRRRYLPEIKNKNQAIRQFAERQAVNTPIQGSASDLIKLAMIHIQYEIKIKGLKTKMVLQIHDELLFDLPEEELAEFVILAREKMEHVLELGVPIKVELKKGRNWLVMEPIF